MILDFLKKVNISDQTINYLKENLNVNILDALNDNQTEVLKIISLFKTIGLIPIEELLMYESHIFLKSSKRVYSELLKYDIPTIVDEINEDYFLIENYL